MKDRRAKPRPNSTFQRILDVAFSAIRKTEAKHGPLEKLSVKYNTLNRCKPNDFEHLSNGVTIIKIIKNRRVLSCIIDTEDFYKVKDRRWYADEGSNTFYAKSTRPTVVKMHQLILPNIKLIDHIDQNGLNNCRNNLREASRSLNALNTNKKRSGGETSLYPGVYKRSNGKYVSAIRINGVRKYLGNFELEAEAAAAYTKAKGESYVSSNVSNSN